MLDVECRGQMLGIDFEMGCKFRGFSGICRGMGKKGETTLISWKIHNLSANVIFQRNLEKRNLHRGCIQRSMRIRLIVDTFFY